MDYYYSDDENDDDGDGDLDDDYLMHIVDLTAKMDNEASQSLIQNF